jgi:hypothetical protein
MYCGGARAFSIFVCASMWVLFCSPYAVFPLDWRVVYGSSRYKTGTVHYRHVSKPCSGNLLNRQNTGLEKAMQIAMMPAL